MICAFLAALLMSPATEGGLTGFWHGADCIPAGLCEALFLFPDGNYFYHVPGGLSTVLGSAGTWRLTDDGLDLELRENRIVLARWNGTGPEVFPSPGEPVVYFCFGGEIHKEAGERPMITDVVSRSMWRLSDNPRDAMGFYLDRDLFSILFENGGQP
jgi:hypothetical protein